MFDVWLYGDCNEILRWEMILNMSISVWLQFMFALKQTSTSTFQLCLSSLVWVRSPVLQILEQSDINNVPLYNMFWYVLISATFISARQEREDLSFCLSYCWADQVWCRDTERRNIETGGGRAAEGITEKQQTQYLPHTFVPSQVLSLFYLIWSHSTVFVIFNYKTKHWLSPSLENLLQISSLIFTILPNLPLILIKSGPGPTCYYIGNICFY